MPQRLSRSSEAAREREHVPREIPFLSLSLSLSLSLARTPASPLPSPPPPLSIGVTGAPGDYHNHADYMLKLIACSRTRESDRPQSLASSRINSTKRGRAGGEGLRRGCRKSRRRNVISLRRLETQRGDPPMYLRSIRPLVETRGGSGEGVGEGWEDEDTRCRVRRCACEKGDARRISIYTGRRSLPAA